MRARGINYDTGFFNGQTYTHEPFDPDRVQREMRIIREDLHCSAIRITGGNLDRLEIAATHAADAGLEVWLSPFTNSLTQDALLVFLADCADRAEHLRLQGADVVFLTGSEISLTTHGFLPGDSLEERVAFIADPLRGRPLVVEVRHKVNAFLRLAVDTVRARFGGRVSYASPRGRRERAVGERGARGRRRRARSVSARREADRYTSIQRPERGGQDPSGRVTSDADR